MTPEPGTIQEFAGRLLAARGASVSPVGRDLLEVRLGPELKQKLRREAVLLAFSEEAAAAVQEAELTTPGSHFFSVLLTLARQRGLVSRRRAKEKARGVGQFLKQVEFENFGVEITDREKYCHLFLRFHFLVSYCSVDSTHELRSVVYDSASRKVCSEPESYWEGLSFEEVPVVQDDASPSRNEELTHGLRVASAGLVAKLKHKVLSFKTRSDDLLEKELERLESYYRRLIVEEGDLGPDAVLRNDGRPGRADGYKLEWQRKAAAEAARFRPRVRISLVGAEEIRVPRTLLTLRVEAHPFTEFYGVFDLASASAKGAFCQGCSDMFMSLRLDGSGAVLCRACSGGADKLD
ncbi:MAG: hypothetical protein JW952_07075 [Candidatus Eisenbacteria bacterium]|nr:hypothetical protein [Candidatus Eisenbacteria bacterium]